MAEDENLVALKLEININPPSVLIVDDNTENLQVLGGFLQNEGLLVEFALDGTSALKWLDKKKFDLILLDIMMPGMNGYEVCSQIKKNPLINETPIIFLTAKTNTKSTIKGFKCGAVDYVTKPFVRDELLARVNTQIEINRSKDQLKQYLHEIEDRNNNITDSINYAQNIQRAIINKSRTVNHLPEHFILFQPKDIVSGDFFWFCEVENIIIIAVMDCTGHGVPGAFMSILGITLLNEIVKNYNILRPDKILNKLRTEIIYALGQDGDSKNVKDGIEGSVISYNEKTKILQFSSSFNPLILIRDNEIIEIKGDRFPVGYYERMKEFTFHETEIKKNDIIYLSTDGYVDQFGGEHDKKFMLSSFKQLLLDIHEKSMTDQRQLLDNKFLEWKGDNEQIDDVLVVGIRL
jgi:sigma-B regulation protein RsbU (phosphoserine phosphatase)